MLTPSKPARPILGLALVLIGLWGGSYLMSFPPYPSNGVWWVFPYIVTVISASAYLIYRGVLLVNPSLKDL